MERFGRLRAFGHKAGAGGNPLLEVFVLDQLLHGVVLKDAEAGLPQVVDRELMGRVGEEDVRRLHGAHQRRGEHGVHLGVLEPLLQVGQLGAAFVAQGDIRSTADVQPLEVARRDAVADQMQFECFHGSKHLDFRKDRLIVPVSSRRAQFSRSRRGTKYIPVAP